MATNEQRKEWKRIGLCSCCGKRRLVDGGLTCQECRDRYKANRDYKREHGICVKCGKNRVAPNRKYCLFYPIGHDLYVKGMFHRYENKKRVNISVKLVNYKNLTGIEAWNILSGKVISESMILDAWNKLGLRLGFMTPILKDLN